MRKLAATLTLALLAVAPAAAQGASVRAAAGDRVISDCTDDGRIQGSYRQRELKGALENLPSDVDQYTDCREKIRRAMLASRGGGRAAGAGGGSGKPLEIADATVEERDALQHAKRQPPEPIALDGGLENGHRAEPITPGVSASNTLPLPILLALIGGGLALGASALDRRRRSGGDGA